MIQKSAIPGQPNPAKPRLKKTVATRRTNPQDSGTRGRRLDATAQAAQVSYAVITPDSGFPAGWVRYDAARAGYFFTTLEKGRGGHATPAAHHEQAVPEWIGAYRLRRIHPIPEDVTGDMIAAAPRMLDALKRLQGALETGLASPLDPEELGALIAMAEGRD